MIEQTNRQNLNYDSPIQELSREPMLMRRITCLVWEPRANKWAMVHQQWRQLFSGCSFSRRRLLSTLSKPPISLSLSLALIHPSHNLTLLGLCSIGDSPSFLLSPPLLPFSPFPGFADLRKKGLPGFWRFSVLISGCEFRSNSSKV